MLTLVIGNKNYSSWSLRPWLFLKVNQIPFKEIRVLLDQPDTRENLLRYSPAAKVPVLLDGDLTIWDSMAIIEHVAERHQSALIWPEDPAARALARSISAEMHSGFPDIRNELPQNIRGRYPIPPEKLSQACRQQTERVQEIWCQCRNKYGQGGPWLFGQFSMADAFFAPVVMRFHTYGIAMDPISQAYANDVRDCGEMQIWIADSHAETENLDSTHGIPTL